ncbi:MAG: death domain-containing protein [Proteobacteria bacterium]|nr:death domain-containing protein [Pseudomonadota bacterium]
MTLFIIIISFAIIIVPKLHQLDYLERNGKKIKLINAVAAHWDKVALRLHFEGYDIDRIAKDHHQQSISAATTVFKEWLNGKGRQPPSWAILIKALQETELFTDVINDLECILGVSNDDLTEPQQALHVSSLSSKSQ